MPEFGELLSLEYWREHALVAAYALAAVVLFVIFLIGTFPYDRALTGALLPMGLKVSYSGEHPAFPVGAVLENFELISLERPSPPVLSSEALRLTPGLGTLFGRPGVGIRADMYGGRVWAKVRREGDMTGLVFDLSNVDLSRYPIPPQAIASLKGIVSGSGSFEIMDRFTNSQTGNLTLDSRDVDFTLIKGFPSLRFTTLKGSFQIDHATLRVTSLEGSGPDMTVSGSGIIHMGPTIGRSIMDMTLRISPTMAGRTRLAVLFTFLPHPPDNRPYFFHGSPLLPQVS